MLLDKFSRRPIPRDPGTFPQSGDPVYMPSPIPDICDIPIEVVNKILYQKKFSRKLISSLE